MTLLYRKELLRQYAAQVGELWLDGIVRYLRDLGIHSEKTNCVEILKSLSNEEDYCGIWNPAQELPKNANYIMIEKDSGTRYWFASPYDAISFVNNEAKIERDLALMGFSQSDKADIEAYFDFYCTRIKNGFWWFRAENVDSIVDTLMRPKLVYCESRRLQFASIDEAARWLCDMKYATNLQRARQQLIKHLAGETALCYKLKFIEY